MVCNAHTSSLKGFMNYGHVIIFQKEEQEQMPNKLGPRKYISRRRLKTKDAYKFLMIHTEFNAYLRVYLDLPSV